MKYSTTFSFLALAASVASSPVAVPELEDRTFFFPGCCPDNKVLILAGLDYQFCSAYLQPTLTAQVVKAAVQTAYATTTATETVVVTSTVTPTAAPLVCGVKGYAAATALNTFYNNDGSFTQASCQAKCASVGPPTGTFAYGGTLCACYVGNPTVAAAYQADAPYTFSDVACPPPSGDAGAALPEGKRDAPAPVCAPASAKIPPKLIQLINPGPARISSACDCLLNKQVPAACTIVKTSTVYATTTILTVQTATITYTAIVTAVAP